MDVVGTIPWNPGGFDHVRKTNPGDFGGPCGPNSRGVSGWHCLLIRIGQGHPRATWMIRGFVHIPAPHLPHDCSFQATDFSPGVPSLLPWPYLVSTSSFPPKQAGSSQPRSLVVFTKWVCSLSWFDPSVRPLDNPKQPQSGWELGGTPPVCPRLRFCSLCLLALLMYLGRTQAAARSSVCSKTIGLF